MLPTGVNYTLILLTSFRIVAVFQFHDAEQYVSKGRLRNNNNVKSNGGI